MWGLTGERQLLALEIGCRLRATLVMHTAAPARLMQVINYVHQTDECCTMKQAQFDNDQFVG